MSSEKLNPLEKLVISNTEKAVALIKSHIHDDDEILYYAVAQTYPAIVNWIPGIALAGVFGFTTKRKYLLAVTRTALLMIQIEQMAIKEVAFDAIPIADILASTVKKAFLTRNLQLTLSTGKTLTFRELDNEYATKLKDAIDLAQADPAALEPEPTADQGSAPTSAPA